MVEIKTVIFDYNGVVTVLGKFDSLIVEYAVRCRVAEEDLEKVVRDKWALARVGKINSMEFWRAIAEVLGYETQQLRQEWLKRFPVRLDVLALVHALQGKGYKTALLTNEIKDWMDEVIPAYSMQNCFDAIVTSYEVGAAKPDRRMYDAVLLQLGMNANQCVYIDDQTKNIVPAEELGFQTILFESVEQMKKELRDFGVRI
jgi:putative hydrolase of the HAD superfamily